MYMIKKKEQNKSLMSSINENELGQIVSILIGCAQRHRVDEDILT